MDGREREQKHDAVDQEQDPVYQPYGSEGRRGDGSYVSQGIEYGIQIYLFLRSANELYETAQSIFEESKSGIQQIKATFLSGSQQEKQAVLAKISAQSKAVKAQFLQFIPQADHNSQEVKDINEALDCIDNLATLVEADLAETRKVGAFSGAVVCGKNTVDTIRALAVLAPLHVAQLSSPFALLASFSSGIQAASAASASLSQPLDLAKGAVGVKRLLSPAVSLYNNSSGEELDKFKKGGLALANIIYGYADQKLQEKVGLSLPKGEPWGTESLDERLNAYRIIHRMLSTPELEAHLYPNLYNVLANPTANLLDPILEAVINPAFSLVSEQAAKAISPLYSAVSACFSPIDKVVPTQFNGVSGTISKVFCAAVYGDITPIVADVVRIMGKSATKEQIKVAVLFVMRQAAENPEFRKMVRSRALTAAEGFLFNPEELAQKSEFRYRSKASDMEPGLFRAGILILEVLLAKWAGVDARPVDYDSRGYLAKMDGPVLQAMAAKARLDATLVNLFTSMTLPELNHCNFSPADAAVVENTDPVYVEAVEAARAFAKRREALVQAIKNCPIEDKDSERAIRGNVSQLLKEIKAAEEKYYHSGVLAAGRLFKDAEKEETLHQGAENAFLRAFDVLALKKREAEAAKSEAAKAAFEAEQKTILENANLKKAEVQKEKQAYLEQLKQLKNEIAEAPVARYIELRDKVESYINELNQKLIEHGQLPEHPAPYAEARQIFLKVEQSEFESKEEQAGYFEYLAQYVPVYNRTVTLTLPQGARKVLYEELVKMLERVKKENVSEAKVLPAADLAQPSSVPTGVVSYSAGVEFEDEEEPVPADVPKHSEEVPDSISPPPALPQSILSNQDDNSGEDQKHNTQAEPLDDGRAVTLRVQQKSRNFLDGDHDLVDAFNKQLTRATLYICGLTLNPEESLSRATELERLVDEFLEVDDKGHVLEKIESFVDDVVAYVEVKKIFSETEKALFPTVESQSEEDDQNEPDKAFKNGFLNVKKAFFQILETVPKDTANPFSKRVCYFAREFLAHPASRSFTLASFTSVPEIKGLLEAKFEQDSLIELQTQLAAWIENAEALVSANLKVVESAPGLEKKTDPDYNYINYVMSQLPQEFKAAYGFSSFKTQLDDWFNKQSDLNAENENKESVESFTNGTKKLSDVFAYTPGSGDEARSARVNRIKEAAASEITAPELKSQFANLASAAENLLAQKVFYQTEVILSQYIEDSNFDKQSGLLEPYQRFKAKLTETKAGVFKALSEGKMTSTEALIVAEATEKLIKDFTLDLYVSKSSGDPVKAVQDRIDSFHQTVKPYIRTSTLRKVISALLTAAAAVGGAVLGFFLGSAPGAVVGGPLGAAIGGVAGAVVVGGAASLLIWNKRQKNPLTGLEKAAKEVAKKTVKPSGKKER